MFKKIYIITSVKTNKLTVKLNENTKILYSKNKLKLNLAVFSKKYFG